MSSESIFSEYGDKSYKYRVNGVDICDILIKKEVSFLIENALVSLEKKFAITQNEIYISIFANHNKNYSDSKVLVKNIEFIIFLKDKFLFYSFFLEDYYNTDFYKIRDVFDFKGLEEYTTVTNSRIDNIKKDKLLKNGELIDLSEVKFKIKESDSDYKTFRHIYLIQNYTIDRREFGIDYSFYPNTALLIENVMLKKQNIIPVFNVLNITISFNKNLKYFFRLRKKNKKCYIFNEILYVNNYNGYNAQLPFLQIYLKELKKSNSNAIDIIERCRKQKYTFDLSLFEQNLFDPSKLEFLIERKDPEIFLNSIGYTIKDNNTDCILLSLEHISDIYHFNKYENIYLFSPLTTIIQSEYLEKEINCGVSESENDIIEKAAIKYREIQNIFFYTDLVTKKVTIHFKKNRDTNDSKLKIYIKKFFSNKNDTITCDCLFRVMFDIDDDFLTSNLQLKRKEFLFKSDSFQKKMFHLYTDVKNKNISVEEEIKNMFFQKKYYVKFVYDNLYFVTFDGDEFVRILFYIHRLNNHLKFLINANHIFKLFYIKYGSNFIEFNNDKERLINLFKNVFTFDKDKYVTGINNNVIDFIGVNNFSSSYKFIEGLYLFYQKNGDIEIGYNVFNDQKLNRFGDLSDTKILFCIKYTKNDNGEYTTDNIYKPRIFHKDFQLISDIPEKIAEQNSLTELRSTNFFIYLFFNYNTDYNGDIDGFTNIKEKILEKYEFKRFDDKNKKYIYAFKESFNESFFNKDLYTFLKYEDGFYFLKQKTNDVLDLTSISNILFLTKDYYSSFFLFLDKVKNVLLLGFCDFKVGNLYLFSLKNEITIDNLQLNFKEDIYLDNKYYVSNLSEITLYCLFRKEIYNNIYTDSNIFEKILNDLKSNFTFVKNRDSGLLSLIHPTFLWLDKNFNNRIGINSIYTVLNNNDSLQCIVLKNIMEQFLFSFNFYIKSIKDNYFLYEKNKIHLLKDYKDYFKEINKKFLNYYKQNYSKPHDRLLPFYNEDFYFSYSPYGIEKYQFSGVQTKKILDLSDAKFIDSYKISNLIHIDDYLKEKYTIYNLGFVLFFCDKKDKSNNFLLFDYIMKNTEKFKYCKISIEFEKNYIIRNFLYHPHYTISEMGIAKNSYFDNFFSFLTTIIDFSKRITVMYKFLKNSEKGNYYEDFSHIKSFSIFSIYDYSGNLSGIVEEETQNVEEIGFSLKNHTIHIDRQNFQSFSFYYDKNTGSILLKVFFVRGLRNVDKFVLETYTNDHYIINKNIIYKEIVEYRSKESRISEVIGLEIKDIKRFLNIIFIIFENGYTILYKLYNDTVYNGGYVDLLYKNKFIYLTSFFNIQFLKKTYRDFNSLYIDCANDGFNELDNITLKNIEKINNSSDNNYYVFSVSKNNEIKKILIEDRIENINGRNIKQNDLSKINNFNFINEYITNSFINKNVKNIVFSENYILYKQKKISIFKTDFYQHILFDKNEEYKVLHLNKLDYSETNKSPNISLILNKTKKIIFLIILTKHGLYISQLFKRNIYDIENFDNVVVKVNDIETLEIEPEKKYFKVIFKTDLNSLIEVSLNINDIHIYTDNNNNVDISDINRINKNIFFKFETKDIIEKQYDSFIYNNFNYNKIEKIINIQTKLEKNNDNFLLKNKLILKENKNYKKPLSISEDNAIIKENKITDNQYKLLRSIFTNIDFNIDNKYDINRFTNQFFRSLLTTKDNNILNIDFNDYDNPGFASDMHKTSLFIELFNLL